ncbi:sensor histidine kinase [Geodermatophilus amargosae]|uniref:sensor histidine kinase n=1 Tax=Geodermatophilus amargosae TaxID=1296565 RepID=UPI000B84074D|nr:histidine kinase [Geodermatophilus amargosae]
MQVRARLLTSVGFAVVALVVVANAAGVVGFGLSGPAAQVTTASAAYAVAAGVFLLWVEAPRRVVVGLLVAMAVAATAVRNADPDGPVVALFLIMAFAPLRLPVREAAATAVASALLFNLEQVHSAESPALFVLVTDGGAAFFFLMGWLLRREHEQRQELEATRDAERVAAALAERSRLAREMHDVLAHTLSGLAVHLEGARLLARARHTAPEVVTALDDAHRLARAGLSEARRAVATLRGDELPGPELVPQLVEEHRRAGGSCTLTVSGDPVPLDPDARLAVYRTVQEGLSNIRKHAPDAPAEVTIRWGGSAVVVVVQDHGGAPAGEPASGLTGYGLTGIAERADLLGGRFRATHGADGFRVELAVPVTS